MLITGGAGFIGVNSADYFAERGWQITVIDNLSRRGASENLRWLQARHAVAFSPIDIRDFPALSQRIAEDRPAVLLHLAAQVAVTTSVENPREDFEINALGTFNVLEAVRLQSPETFVINASTNKVYGRMEAVAIQEREGRYSYVDLPDGVSEEQPLDFHSPYGCSKGVADQYCIDYGRIYGLRTTTFRQSCIYGPRQFGIEDQGWVAWFAIAAVLGKPITIYGDGKQIRDVLHVRDLARAYRAAIERQDAACAQAFNIGGGPHNTLSLRELIRDLESELGTKIALNWEDWRPGDQPVFVCDTSKAKERLGWAPEISVLQGVQALIQWVRDHRSLFEELRKGD